MGVNTVTSRKYLIPVEGSVSPTVPVYEYAASGMIPLSIGITSLEIGVLKSLLPKAFPARFASLAVVCTDSTCRGVKSGYRLVIDSDGVVVGKKPLPPYKIFVAYRKALESVAAMPPNEKPGKAILYSLGIVSDS
jgi:hypothetical protein